MSLSPISSNIINLLSEEPVSTKSSGFGELASNFSDIFNAALNTVAETDQADKASSLELLSGESDDLSGLMLDIQKAEISLNLTLQIRNKVVEAYNDVMRIQV